MNSEKENISKLEGKATENMQNDMWRDKMSQNIKKEIITEYIFFLNVHRTFTNIDQVQIS